MPRKDRGRSDRKSSSTSTKKKNCLPLEEQAFVVLQQWLPTIPATIASTSSLLHEIVPLEKEATVSQTKAIHQREEYMTELLMRYDRATQGEELTLEEKVKAQSKLDTLHDLSEEISEVALEKIQIATQAYDLVDAEIQRLDAAVAHIESDYSTETTVLRDVSAHREHAKRLALRKAMPTTPGGTSCGGAALRGGLGSSLPIASPGDVKYCVCQAPAHGKMVSCDNETCLVEWFHLSCVGLKEPPKVGKWYCPECFDLLGDPNNLRKKRRKVGRR